METDIIINHLNHNGLTIDPADNCKLFVPQGTIIRVRNTYAICKHSKHLRIDCESCVGRYPNGHVEGVCETLMCTANEREDETEVYFEVLDND